MEITSIDWHEALSLRTARVLGAATLRAGQSATTELVRGDLQWCAGPSRCILGTTTKSPDGWPWDATAQRLSRCIETAGVHTRITRVIINFIVKPTKSAAASVDQITDILEGMSRLSDTPEPEVLVCMTLSETGNRVAWLAS